MSTPTTIRLDPKLKKRIEKLARALDQSPHSLMVAGIEESVRDAEARLAFVKEARRRKAEFDRDNVGYELADLRDWFCRSAKGERVAFPAPRRLSDE